MPLCVTFNVTIYAHRSNAINCIVVAATPLHHFLCAPLLLRACVYASAKSFTICIHLCLNFGSPHQTIYCEKGENLCEVIKRHKRQVGGNLSFAVSLLVGWYNLNLNHIFQFIVDSLPKMARHTQPASTHRVYLSHRSSLFSHFSFSHDNPSAQLIRCHLP